MDRPHGAFWLTHDGAMSRRIRGHDWDATPLGPIERWPAALRIGLSTILAQPMPMVLAWGPNLLTLPNDAYRALLGTRGDRLGEPLPEVWSEAEELIAPLLARALSGEATQLTDAPFPVISEGRVEIAYFDHGFGPVRDEAGRIVGVLATAVDTTARVLAEEQRRADTDALSAAEAHQRHIIELVPALLWWTDPQSNRIAVNARWLSYTGQSVPETLDFGWLAMIHPDEREETSQAFRHGVASGMTVEREQRIRRSDGDYRWHQVRHIPIRDAEGRVERWYGAAIDIHESKLAQQALAHSERLSRALIEGVPQLIWRAVDGGDWTWASPQWTEFTGQPEVESHGHGWLDPVHPDDRESAMRFWHKAEQTGRLEMDGRLRHAETGGYRWFQTRATPVRAADGTIVEWLGTSTDVDDLRGLQNRQQVLVAELQHRVRNILTVIRSVFDRTVEADGRLEAMVEHFRGRLDNLARTQVVVTQSASGTVNLRNLVYDELLSVGCAECPKVTLDGPEIALDARTAESMGLAIHELTTNAVKYGALKIPEAKLTIRWVINSNYGGSFDLSLTWTEQGVPAVPLDPVRHGFGMELIEQALPYQLGAETTLEFRGGGIRCTITVPLPGSAT